MSSPSVYLSAAMSKYGDRNKALFETWAQHLADHRIRAITPFYVAENAGLTEGNTYAEHLLADLKFIASCHAVCLIDHMAHKRSPGVKAEVAFARACKVPIFQRISTGACPGLWFSSDCVQLTTDQLRHRLIHE